MDKLEIRSLSDAKRVLEQNTDALGSDDAEKQARWTEIIFDLILAIYDGIEKKPAEPGYATQTMRGATLKTVRKN